MAGSLSNYLMALGPVWASGTLMFFNNIQAARPLLARFKCCPMPAERMRTRSGGFHCRATRALTVMAARRIALGPLSRVHSSGSQLNLKHLCGGSEKKL